MVPVNVSTLSQFLNESFVIHANGERVPLERLTARFHAWLGQRGESPVAWTKKQIRNVLEEEKFELGFVKGWGLCVANLFDPTQSQKRYVRVGRDLQFENISA